MNYTIRNAQKSDAVHMLALIQELADFEKEPNAVQVTLEELTEAGFGERPCYHCFVAEVNQQVVGMALVYPRYSTWKGPVLHLEDLIVTKAMRGTGIGSALLKKVVTYGKEQGVRRIGWEVLDWNEPAIAFYESKGANVMRDWDVVQLNEEGIERFLEQ
ncbi:GCN5-related N-acetyltransferase [Croceitalea dokdonensis DOKDO 023]|uniref:GCN5-related N-acetyltransferase n=1 Tax=Croceitalea dokdonensis DOKDO 023 TaxID=1300341 RepID=A0A0P7A6B8_9FLAO|nr:GNAT family N-acetyltransferase [Croceitalea dokdonensis]KPM32274.1 GCN5-related N-acetyltransferase [Croceitalea dokdonensis DOKDO 023]